MPASKSVPCHGVSVGKCRVCITHSFPFAHIVQSYRRVRRRQVLYFIGFMDRFVATKIVVHGCRKYCYARSYRRVYRPCCLTLRSASWKPHQSSLHPRSYCPFVIGHRKREIGHSTNSVCCGGWRSSAVSWLSCLMLCGPRIPLGCSMWCMIYPLVKTPFCVISFTFELSCRKDSGPSRWELPWIIVIYVEFLQEMLGFVTFRRIPLPLSVAGMGTSWKLWWEMCCRLRGTESFQTR